MSPTTAALIVLAILVVLLAAAGAGLLRRVRELELAVYRGVGLQVPGQSGAAPLDASLTNPGRVSVVAKLTSRCPACAEVLHGLANGVSAAAGAVDLVAVSDDPGLADKAPPGVRVITDPVVWRSLRVPFVPAVLVVDGKGLVVESRPGGSGTVVAELIERARKLNAMEMA